MAVVVVVVVVGAGPPLVFFAKSEATKLLKRLAVKAIADTVMIRSSISALWSS